MNKSYIRKNIRLSNEFDSYMVSSRSARTRVPSGAHIILTSSKDRSLSESNLAIARNSRGRKFVVAHNANGRWYIKDFVR